MIDIPLEEAIEKTRQAGIKLSFEQGQTVVGDLFVFRQEIKNEVERAKQEIERINNSVNTIHWVFTVIVVGAVTATIVLLADYAQFATKAYDEFTATTKEQAADHYTIESIKNDITLIKNTIIQPPK